MAYTDVVFFGLDNTKHDMICQLKGQSIPFTKSSKLEPHNINVNGQDVTIWNTPEKPTLSSLTKKFSDKEVLCLIFKDVKYKPNMHFMIKLSNKGKVVCATNLDVQRVLDCICPE